MVKYENRASANELLKDEYFKDMTKIESIDVISPLANVQKELIDKAKK